MKTKTSANKKLYNHIRKTLAFCLFVAGFLSFCVLSGESSEVTTTADFILFKGIAAVVLCAVVMIARKVFPDAWGNGNEA